MIRKDKLHTVNKWNRPAFIPEEHLFPDGGKIALKDTFSKQGLKAAGEGLVGGLAGSLGTAVGGLAGNAIAGGLQSGAGSAISNIGGMAASAIGSVNPLAGAIVGVGSQLVGGLTNRAFGTKVNQEQLNQVNSDISAMNNFRSSADSFDDIQSPVATASASGIYKGGWFSSGKARKKNQELQDKLNAGKQFAQRSVDNNINNLQEDQMNSALANFSAYGGPLEQMIAGGYDGMGAINYGFLSDYLTTKQQQNTAKDRFSVPTMFALGGDVQTNGSDFTTGLSRVSAGGSHESNPNEGVQVGVDSEGTPNLVEEGETIFNDYVYSARILADAETKQYFHLPKKRDISFADISKRLEKEASERPNDPISRAGLEAQMSKLAEHQERQKQEMEAERAKAAFEALSPEEKVAVIQQHAQQEQMAQQQAMQGAGVQQQTSGELPLDATAMEQQQMLQGDGSQAMLGAEPQMAAMGGKLNKFTGGGHVVRGTDGLVDYSQSVFDLPEVVVEGHQRKPVKQQVALTPEQARQAVGMMQALEEIDRQEKQDRVMDALQEELNQRQDDRALYRRNRIHYYADGGRAYTRLVNSLGFHTQKEFDDWAAENKIDLSKIWGNADRTLNNDILSSLWKDENFKKALREKDPALAHAFTEKGYNFGAYQPSENGKATIQSISRGNWKATDGRGWRGSDDLAFKQATEGMSDAEIDALTTEQLAERMQATDAYKNTSQWLQTPDNALLYLTTLLNDPDTPEVAKQYARKYVQDGAWKDGYNYSYDDVFGKVRATNPGTYWHSVMEANRGNQTGNFVINEDGSVEPILGDVPTDWKSAGNYTWADESNDYAYNYYRKPVTSPAVVGAEATTRGNDGEDTNGDTGGDKTLRHRWESLRYAGLFGPAAGLGLMAAGIGRPDTASIDAALSGSGDVSLARYKPLGNYLTYRPLDIWAEQNRMDANARATDRNIMNTSGGNRGAAMAGLIANGYNSQLADGQLFRQAQEYNDNLRKQVAEFNRGTDQWNSGQFGETSRFNANARNQARQANAGLRMRAAAEKADMNAGWYNSLYGNLSGLFKGLGDIGTENYRMNRIAEMAKAGVFNNLGDSALSGLVFKSEGGEVKRKKGKKKGLTY